MIRTKKFFVCKKTIEKLSEKKFAVAMYIFLKLTAKQKQKIVFEI